MNYISVAVVLLAVVPIALSDSMVGGYSAAQDPTAEVTELFSTFEYETRTALGIESSNCTPTVLSFQTQVVAGVNYKITVDLCTDGVATVKIFKPLPNTGLEPEFITAVWNEED